MDVTNPILWTNQDLIEWLKTAQNGRYWIFYNQLKPFNGKDILFFHDDEWKKLYPSALSNELRFVLTGMHKIIPITSSLSSSKSLSQLSTFPNDNMVIKGFNKKLMNGYAKYEDKIQDIHKTKPVPFPPMIEKPALWHIILIFIIILLIILFSTVLKKPLLDVDSSLTTGFILGKILIPTISVVFTYFHIWLALYMTFYPLVFIGFFQIPGTNVGLPGWEGIIPNKAEKMARQSVKLMTTQLMDVKEVFSKVDPEKVAEILQPLLTDTIHEIIQEMAMKYNPKLWNVLPTKVKNEIIEKIREESPEHIKILMDAIRNNIEQVFDIEDMVVTNMLKDKQLLVNMFIICGYNELAFIRNSGAYMGGLFGLIQMGISFLLPSNKAPELWHEYLIFPGFGLIVGILTNWLALKMIFEPVKPVKIGPILLHGLFLRRQLEVAKVYGKMVAADVLNGKNMFEAILKGPASDKLFELVYENVQKAVNSGAAVTEKIVTISIGEKMYENIKDDVTDLIVNKFPHNLRLIESYATEAMDLENTLTNKMVQLTSEQFEGLLHPIFQEDEWKLVLMGGGLGVLIGILQIYGIEHPLHSITVSTP